MWWLAFFVMRDFMRYARPRKLVIKVGRVGRPRTLWGWFWRLYFWLCLLVLVPVIVWFLVLLIPRLH